VPTGALSQLPPSPEERIALLEAAVIGLEERIVSLESRLGTLLTAGPLTREGPAPNLRCSGGFLPVNDIIIRATNNIERATIVSLYPDSQVFATWSDCRER
jgi:hypothetical protein